MVFFIGLAIVLFICLAGFFNEARRNSGDALGTLLLSVGVYILVMGLIVPFVFHTQHNVVSKHDIDNGAVYSLGDYGGGHTLYFEDDGKKITLKKDTDVVGGDVENGTYITRIVSDDNTITEINNVTPKWLVPWTINGSTTYEIRSMTDWDD